MPPQAPMKFTTKNKICTSLNKGYDNKLIKAVAKNKLHYLKKR